MRRRRCQWIGLAALVAALSFARAQDVLSDLPTTFPAIDSGPLALSSTSEAAPASEAAPTSSTVLEAPPAVLASTDNGAEQTRQFELAADPVRTTTAVDATRDGTERSGTATGTGDIEAIASSVREAIEATPGPTDASATPATSTSRPVSRTGRETAASVASTSASGRNATNVAEETSGRNSTPRRTRTRPTSTVLPTTVPVSSTASSRRTRSSSATRGRQDADASSAARPQRSTSTATRRTSSSPSRSSSVGRASNTARPATASTRACEPAPPTFAGTYEGFQNLCTRRYCAPDGSVPGRVQWSGIAGNVTRLEIESALRVIAKSPAVLENFAGNQLADGPFGQTEVAAGLLFEMTGDIRALDEALRRADNILWLRNNPVNGTVIWTGRREAVWPTYHAKNSSFLVYAGCEQGNIVGHLVNSAVYILKTPCLWDQVPPVYESGPTVFAAGDTYLTRALALVQAGDETVTDYFIPNFFDRDNLLIQPDDVRWNLVMDASNRPGAPMPWNRRMLMLHAFHRLAAAHETLPAYDVLKTWRYDQLIQANVKDFISSLNQSMEAGFDTFIWDYVDEKENIEESRGVHAYFDILGVWQAWQRNERAFGVTRGVGMGLANTMELVIHQGNGTFSGLVNGESTDSSMGVPGLWGGWSFYAFWRPEWLETLVEANLDSGYGARPWLSVPLLWTKNARQQNDLSLWKGHFSTGNPERSNIVTGMNSSSTTTSSLGLNSLGRITLPDLIIANGRSMKRSSEIVTALRRGESAGELVGSGSRASFSRLLLFIVAAVAASVISWD